MRTALRTVSWTPHRPPASSPSWSWMGCWRPAGSRPPRRRCTLCGAGAPSPGTPPYCCSPQTGTPRYRSLEERGGRRAGFHYMESFSRCLFILVPCLRISDKLIQYHIVSPFSKLIFSTVVLLFIQISLFLLLYFMVF